MMDENIPAIKSRGRRERNGNKGNLIFVVLAVSKGILSCRTYNDSNLFHRLEATVKDTSEPRTDRMCLIDPFYCDGHNKFMEENTRRCREGETEVRAEVRGGSRRVRKRRH